MGTPIKIRWLTIQCEFQDPKMEVLYHIRPGKKPAVKKDMSRSEKTWLVVWNMNFLFSIQLGVS